MLGVQLANVSTRCSSHPQGKSEVRCENDGNFLIGVAPELYLRLASSLAGKTSSHVLNSKHFTGVMKEERVEADEALISFDVTSLFTNVPTEEAVEVIHRKLTEEENLVERTPISLERIAALSEIHLIQLQW